MTLHQISREYDEKTDRYYFHIKVCLTGNVLRQMLDEEDFYGEVIASEAQSMAETLSHEIKGGRVEETPMDENSIRDVMGSSVIRDLTTQANSATRRIRYLNAEVRTLSSVQDVLLKKTRTMEAILNKMGVIFDDDIAIVPQDLLKDKK